MVRQTIFRTIVVDVGTAAMGFFRRRDIGLNSKYDKEKWEFIAMERGGVFQWMENY